MAPRAEALLYAAARAQLVQRAARAAARRRRRWCCSTASSTPRSPTRAPGARSASSRCARSTSSPPAAWRPTARCCCASPPPTAARARTARASARPAGARGRRLLRAIAAAYDELARAEPARIRVIDACPAAHAACSPTRSRDRGPTMNIAVSRRAHSSPRSWRWHVPAHRLCARSRSPAHTHDHDRRHSAATRPRRQPPSPTSTHPDDHDPRRDRHRRALGGETTQTHTTVIARPRARAHSTAFGTRLDRGHRPRRDRRAVAARVRRLGARPLARLRAALAALAAPRDGRGGLPRVGHMGRIHRLGPPGQIAVGGPSGLLK